MAAISKVTAACPKCGKLITSWADSISVDMLAHAERGECVQIPIVEYTLPEDAAKVVPLGTRAFQYGECNVLLNREGGLLHLSISHPSRYPTWDEIKDVRYRMLPPDITAAMLLPPNEDYVNTHPNCFHIWESPLDSTAGEGALVAHFLKQTMLYAEKNRLPLADALMAVFNKKYKPENHHE